jgi:HPt (histidine-containing phosphotransfer) domain-containing protein
MTNLRSKNDFGTLENPSFGGCIDEIALANLKELELQGATNLVAKLIQIYLESSLQLIETLREAVNLKNIAALHSAAHTLKSASATLGAAGLAQLCRELECDAREKSTVKAPELLEKIQMEHHNVHSALTLLLQRELQH